MADMKESYEEKMDSTFEMYKEALKEHAYQCALERLEEEYVPVDEFTAEQDRAKVSGGGGDQSLNYCMSIHSGSLSFLFD